METVFVKKERTIPEIPLNAVRISFKSSDSLIKTGGTYIKMKFQVSEEVKLEHKFYVEKDDQQTWQIDE